MHQFKQISPMIPSEDVVHTRDFLKSTMAFSLVMDDPSYVILEKDNQSVHLCPTGKDYGESSFYILVENIESLWDSIKDKLSNLSVRPLFTQPYGMKEFHIILPATKTLMLVGESPD